MSSNSVYVITGANRGIGLGLVEAYLQRPATTVVGIVRSEASAAMLNTAAEKVTKGAGSNVQAIILDFTKVESPHSAREEFIAAIGELGHINTLICSAGHVAPMPPTLAVTAEELRESFEVNTIAPLITFQALWPLMEKGFTATGSPPKFVVLSSSVGSIGAMEPMPGGAYGPSKAAVNHIVKSLHVQMADAKLIAIALHPGWVQTDMGRFAAKEWNYDPGPPITVEESVRGVTKVVDEATRNTTSGKFILETGKEFPW